MTPPTDSLEAALAKVPLRCTICRFRAPDCVFSHEHTSFERRPDELAAAAREWMRRQMPASWYIQEDTGYELRERRQAYNDALADVATALGL
jgi:hypothetical protein